MAALLCADPLLIALLNPSADRASTDLIGPYFGAMDVVLALWTGLGLMVAGCMGARIQAQPPPDTVARS
jgi:hypothetical protein